MFEPRPTKQSQETFKPEKTIAKTQTTKRYGFHVMGKFYMVFYLLVLIYLGAMLIINPEFRTIFVLLFIGYFLIVLLNYLQTTRSEIILTDRRLIFKDSVSQEPKDIPFETVLNVLPVSPWIGKLFKYGHIEFVLETQANVEIVKGVVDPKGFTDKAMKALIEHAKKTNKGPRA